MTSFTRVGIVNSRPGDFHEVPTGLPFWIRFSVLQFPYFNHCSFFVNWFGIPLSITIVDQSCCYFHVIFFYPYIHKRINVLTPVIFLSFAYSLIIYILVYLFNFQGRILQFIDRPNKIHSHTRIPNKSKHIDIFLLHTPPPERTHNTWRSHLENSHLEQFAIQTILNHDNFYQTIHIRIIPI